MFEATTKTQRVVASSAMALAFAGYFPQVYQIVQNQSADDISTLFLLFVMIAAVLWDVYAFLRRDIMMFIAYTFGLLMTVLILVLKVYYRRDRNRGGV